jgi:hypothetical protein
MAFTEAGLSQIPVFTTKAKLDEQPITAGALYYITDEMCMYMDTQDNKRIAFGSVVSAENLETLKSLPDTYKSAQKIYCAIDTNRLYRWNGTDMIEVSTPDAEIISVMDALDTRIDELAEQISSATEIVGGDEKVEPEEELP